MQKERGSMIGGDDSVLARQMIKQIQRMILDDCSAEDIYEYFEENFGITSVATAEACASVLGCSGIGMPNLLAIIDRCDNIAFANILLEITGNHFDRATDEYGRACLQYCLTIINWVKNSLQMREELLEVERLLVLVKSGNVIDLEKGGELISTRQEFEARQKLLNTNIEELDEALYRTSVAFYSQELRSISEENPLAARRRYDQIMRSLDASGWSDFIRRNLVCPDVIAKS